MNVTNKGTNLYISLNYCVLLSNYPYLILFFTSKDDTNKT